MRPPGTPPHMPGPAVSPLDAGSAADDDAGSASEGWQAMSRGVVRRQDKAMGEAEIEDLLARARLAHFATVGPNGDPYVVPNLFVWAERKVFLHTTRAAGHFRANVELCARVSFDIAEIGEIFPYGEFECDTSASYASLVGFGSIAIVAANEEKARFFDRFLAKYADPGWARPKGFYPRLDEVCVYAITPERITGKKGPLPAKAEQWPARNLTKSPGAVPRGR
jgi:nitroimidazol reductase NimA-like FMN-containing flavoprotein (pyridoxamine 5'-phosphate oxidase superfamily)